MTNFMGTLHHQGLKSTLEPLIKLTPDGYFQGVKGQAKAFNIIHTTRNGTPTVRLEPTPLLNDTFRQVVVNGEKGPLGHGLEGLKAVFMQGHNKGGVYEESVLTRFYTGLIKRVEQAMPARDITEAQVHTPFKSWDAKPLKTSTGMHFDRGSNTVALHYGEQRGIQEGTGLPVVKLPKSTSRFNPFASKESTLAHVALEPRHNNDAFGLYHNHKRHGTPHGAVTPVLNSPRAEARLSQLKEGFNECLSDEELNFQEFNHRRQQYYDAQIRIGKEEGTVRELWRYEPLSLPAVAEPRGKLSTPELKKIYTQAGLTPEQYQQHRNPYTRGSQKQANLPLGTLV